MRALEWVSQLMGCVQYIQGVHVFVFITNNSSLMRYLLVFAVCCGLSVFSCPHISETHLRKRPPKRWVAGADASSCIADHPS